MTGSTIDLTGFRELFPTESGQYLLKFEDSVQIIGRKVDSVTARLVKDGISHCYLPHPQPMLTGSRSRQIDQEYLTIDDYSTNPREFGIGVRYILFNAAGAHHADDFPTPSSVSSLKDISSLISIWTKYPSDAAALSGFFWGGGYTLEDCALYSVPTLFLMLESMRTVGRDTTGVDYRNLFLHFNAMALNAPFPDDLHGRMLKRELQGHSWKLENSGKPYRR